MKKLCCILVMLFVMGCTHTSESNWEVSYIPKEGHNSQYALPIMKNKKTGEWYLMPPANWK